MGALPKVVVVGARGHARSHVERMLRLRSAGVVDFVGVADPADIPAEELDASVPRFPSLDALLAEAAPDITVISTPIHTHFALAEVAARAGSDVLLEKPPTATLDEFNRLAATVAETGVLAQVGFQTLGSAALDHIRRRIGQGVIGEVTGYSASASWVRPDTYWNRARWAGHRTLDGAVVADGVLTNPLAHSISAALAVAGASGVEDVAAVELDLYHANPIEADDTSVARLTLANGLTLVAALTLCGPEREEPYVVVTGTAGRIILYYAIDVVQEYTGGREYPFTTRHDRVDLLENLIAARRNGARLVSPLAGSGGFMKLVEAVVTSPAPRPIAPEFTHTVEVAGGRAVVVDGIRDALLAAIVERKTFRELGLPWT